MKTILCTGDSHTWGQGVSGLEESFDPPVTAGDLRLIPFAFSSYVNQLRQRVNALSTSSAQELTAADLCRFENIGFESGCAAFGSSPLNFSSTAGLVRIQFLSAAAPSKAAVYIDGKLQREIDLYCQNPANGYKTESFFCDHEGEHLFTIAALVGTVLVYRVELYLGSTAVVNCGIGSCPTFRFMTEYWEKYVARLRPSVVVLEPHTINDWLAGDPPQVYHQRLIEMIRKFQSTGCDIVMLTVSPIAGAQDIPFNKVPYFAYVEESRKAARECGIPLCDTNAIMRRRLDGLSGEQADSLLFHDNWHVSDLGHRIYADAIFEVLTINKLI